MPGETDGIVTRRHDRHPKDTRNKGILLLARGDKMAGGQGKLLHCPPYRARTKSVGCDDSMVRAPALRAPGNVVRRLILRQAGRAW